ncbi:unnamed protein product [Effrenium voratum]|nr:unnamed protein product [Effrenium voratum]
MHTRAGRTSCVSALCQPAGHHAPPWARTHLDGLALSRKHFWPQVDSCPLWLAPALCWSLPWPWLWPPSVDGALWHPRRQGSCLGLLGLGPKRGEHCCGSHRRASSCSSGRGHAGGIGQQFQQTVRHQIQRSTWAPA